MCNQSKNSSTTSHHWPDRCPAMPSKAGSQHLQLFLGKIDVLPLNVVPFSSFFSDFTGGHNVKWCGTYSSSLGVGCVPSLPLVHPQPVNFCGKQGEIDLAISELFTGTGKTLLCYHHRLSHKYKIQLYMECSQ